MYFQTSELNSIATEWGEPTVKEIKTILTHLREELLTNHKAYRDFGGYWQEMKILLLSQNPWNNTKNLIPLLPAALAYRDLQNIGTEPGDHEETLYHLWETPQGGTDLGSDLVSVYDPRQEAPSSGQLDLFQDLEDKQRETQAFLSSPGDFLPRTWKEKADELLYEGNFHKAVRCYKRSALLSQDPLYRGEMWLAMGLALESAAHHRKALLCFQNAYEKAQEGWILGHIAQSYQSLERYTEARQFYRKALISMPGNPEYLAALERLEPMNRSNNHRNSETTFNRIELWGQELGLSG